MKYIIEKKNSLKIFYYFMAIDGKVTSDEMMKFEELVKEIDYENYDSYRTELTQECDERISSARVDNEQYEVIQEAVDQIIHTQTDTCTEGLSRRHLIWNLYALSFSDGDLSEEEKRFIAHLGRILGVEKSVLLEMEQLMKTATAIMDELKVLNSSTRPYLEVKPLVEEIEHRKSVLLKAAQNLIMDDYFEISVPKEKNKALINMGKKLNEAISPVANVAGEKAQKTLKDAKVILGETASKGARGLKSGTEKLIKKFGKS